VWHASAGLGGHLVGPFDAPLLERRALRALEGVGDAELGQWVDRGLKAVHVRRRLRPDEWGDQPWGRDVRNTPEGFDRLKPVARLLPAGWCE
jgi:photosystem II stability/assembly factor-like uncharacterized protein